MTNHDFTLSVMSKVLLKEASNSEQIEQSLHRFYIDCEEYFPTGNTERIWLSWKQNMDFIQNGFIFAGRRILLRWLYNRVSDKKWKSSIFSIRTWSPHLPWERAKTKRMTFAAV